LSSFDNLVEWLVVLSVRWLVVISVVSSVGWLCKADGVV
jgi:hypothetical protein